VNCLLSPDSEMLAPPRLCAAAALAARSRLSRRCFSALAAPPLTAADEALLAALLAPPAAGASLRADALLAQNGLCARADARRFLRTHDVRDGSGAFVLSASARVAAAAAVTVDGAPVPFAGAPPITLALNKPPGAVCSAAADEGATVFDLLPPALLARRPALACVGRLDRNSTGLLILTQHGALLERLTRPERHVRKEYSVALRRELDAGGTEARAFAAGGIALACGALTLPAELRAHRELRNVARVVLREGRHHQLRRMFASLGHEVVAIHRTAVGGLRLDALAEGAFRVLGEADLRALLAGGGGKDGEEEKAGGGGEKEGL
jgi:16S rRNA pseudouridine516 synthase